MANAGPMIAIVGPGPAEAKSIKPNAERRHKIKRKLKPWLKETGEPKSD